MNEAIQLILFLTLLVVLAPMLGKFMSRVFTNENHIMKPVFGWLENLVYRVSGIGNKEEMNWK
ncbi:MAG TPA: potassium-transporting ATPase subunit KdpA, partial [Bacteroidales bacterium]|nr:potassium-transporting ATPase subunit KdpA [Bacteroidales bacterium]